MPTRQRAMIAVVAVAVVASIGVLAWTVLGQRPVAAEFAVGDCADGVAFDGTPVYEVVKVDCADLHEVEVFAEVVLAGADEYPGDTEVDARAARLCRTAASAELVALDPGWQVKVLRPSVASWEAGDRTATCFLTRASGNKTAGSITSQ